LQARPSIEADPTGAVEGTVRPRLWLGFALFVLIAICSVVLALVVHAREQDSFETNQRSEAFRAAHQAEALAALSVGQLASAVAFYQAEPDFSQHEFDVVAGSLLDSGSLRATAFIDSVPDSERRRFESEHGFEIVERGSLGQLRRASGRPHHYPVAFAAATGLTVQLPLGYDVGTDPRRGPYLDRARDTGRPAATRAMRLPIGDTGINVFRPVFRDGAPTRTPAQRRAALVGFAGGGFRVDDLSGAAAETLPADVDISLVEGGRVVSGPSLSREESAAAPIRIADRTWLLVLGDPNRPGIALPLLIAVFGLSLGALLGALILIWSRNERMRELKRQASQDSLTGLKNRRRFEQDLRAELARSHRYRTRGALLLLDLDRFKRVNDTLGHAAGDRVLAEIAGILSARARETDVVARLGGDEFAIVLPHCDLAEARRVGGEIAAAIREHARAAGDLPEITASIGIAGFGAGRRLGWEALLARADAAMYTAKEEGRDSVRAFGSDEDPETAGDSAFEPV
jgi:diguanylate cyclase (GGDEF)-like protein